MLVYKIYAKHEDKMVEKFSRGWMPTYTKYGNLFYSEKVALKNLAKCEEFKASSEKNKNFSFELITYEMKEV